MDSKQACTKMKILNQGRVVLPGECSCPNHCAQEAAANSSVFEGSSEAAGNWDNWPWAHLISVRMDTESMGLKLRKTLRQDVLVFSASRWESELCVINDF